MLKIDFGSGYHPKKGFKTCDITYSPNLDYVYDREKNIILYLEKNTVDEFFLKNVLHHTNVNKVIECLHFYLKQNGKITIIEPQKLYYNQNRSLDIFWYRYIYPRYEIDIPNKKRVDYLSICLEYFQLEKYYIEDVYDVYIFRKKGI